MDFEDPNPNRKLTASSDSLPRQICILPFPFTDVLLQGETKQLRLYEDRFIHLFEDCIENHAGMVAMGLLADPFGGGGIIQTVPLCEIQAYNRMEEFGIFVTIRVVGRARLLDIIKQEPYIKAVCQEVSDTIPPNLEMTDIVAGNIENFILLLSSMEHKLRTATSKDNGEESPVDEEDAEMQRRINLAKLEDRFYLELDDDDNEDEDEDESDIDQNQQYDRRKRFQMAYDVALATDKQGYRVRTDGNDRGEEKEKIRSPQELTALSWAAFCTELLPEADATMRIQALDSDDLFERLKLASILLRQKKEDVQAKMEKAGLKFRNEDMDDVDEAL